MEVWAGDVIFDVTSIRYHDIRLCSSVPVSRPFSGTTELHFLSLVETVRIPLYLVAGPSLSVRSEDTVTEEWLADCLLPQELGEHTDVLRQGQQAQLCTGILLRVVGHQGGTAEYALTVTELLLYAVVYPTTTGTLLPTPPESSSPHAALEQSHSTFDAGSPEVKVYALPLSSERCYGAHSPTRVLCTSVAGAPDAQGFSETQEPCTNINRLSRKRHKLSSIFDEARQQRHKLKGGGGVAKTMAGFDAPSRQSKAIKLEEEEDKGIYGLATQMEEHRESPNLSRMQSISSIHEYGQPRPHNRRATLTTRRSNLNRVASVYTFDSGPPYTGRSSSIEEQNKSALTRVVMTGMRLFGIQQQKRGSRSRTASELPGPPDSSSNPAMCSESDDTYKLIYHQTFKASLFTFRAHVAINLISQDAMRGVVDRFLSIFCTDPFSTHSENQGQTLGHQLAEIHNAFDPPRRV